MAVKWAAALDVGATHVSAGMVSSQGRIELKREMSSRAGESSSLKDRLFDLTAELLDRAARKKIRPAGIALGAPGIVDTEKGVLVAAGNLPELFGLPLGPELTERFGLPALLENDVNAQAVGELAFGVARGVKNFVLFSIGTDLGGGIVIDGKLHRGAHNIAAEFGHLTLELEGAPCVCGGQGCVREWVSGAGLAEKARELLPESSRLVSELKGHRGRINAERLFQSARKGDAEAERLIEEFARRFGAAAAGVMKVLDPELIVLAGEMFRAEHELIARVVNWTRQYYFPIPQLPDFRVSELTKETAVLGPAAAFFLAHRISAGPPRSRRKGRKS